MVQARQQCGFTLVELVLSIMVIGIALAGLVSVMNLTVFRSADPMLTEQAVAIAEAYMEEILVKDYNDPDGGANVVEASRDLYDCVDDYAVITGEVPTDQDGNAMAGLGTYSVAVAVQAPAAVTGEAMKHVAVTVSHAGAGISYTLHGYKSDWTP